MPRARKRSGALPSATAKRLAKRALVEVAAEASATVPRSERIVPKRRITRPIETMEHLITDADLVEIETNGDGQLHTYAVFFLGGALSAFIPFVGAARDWMASTQPIDIVDLIGLGLFPVCAVIAAILFRFAPTPNRKLRAICKRIRERQSIDVE